MIIPRQTKKSRRTQKIVRNIKWKYGHFDYADRSFFVLRFLTFLIVVLISFDLNPDIIDDVVFKIKEFPNENWKTFLFAWQVYTILFSILIIKLIDRKLKLPTFIHLNLKLKNADNNEYSVKNLIYLITLIIDAIFIFYLMDKTGGKHSTNYVFLFLIVSLHCFYWKSMPHFYVPILVITSVTSIYVCLEGAWGYQEVFNLSLLVIVGLSAFLINKRDQYGYMKLKQFAERLKVGSALYSKGEMENNGELVKTIMDEIFKLYHPQYAELYIIENNKRLYRKNAISVQKNSCIKKYSSPDAGSIMNIDDTVIKRCIITGEPLLYSKIKSKHTMCMEYPDTNKEIAEKYEEYLNNDIYMLVIVPLMINKEGKPHIIGCIRLINRIKYQKNEIRWSNSYEDYTNDDIDALTTIARLLAFRISNESVFSEMTRIAEYLMKQKTELEYQVKLKSSIIKIVEAAKQENINDALKMICKAFEELTNAEKSSLWILDENKIVMRQANGMDPKANGENTVLELSDSFVGKVAKENEVKYLKNPMEDSFYKWRKTCGELQIIGIPLMGSKDTISAVLCTHPEKTVIINDTVLKALHELSNLVNLVLNYLQLREFYITTDSFRSFIRVLIENMDSNKEEFYSKVVQNIMEILKVEASSMFTIDIKGEYGLILSATTDPKYNKEIGRVIYEKNEGITAKIASSRRCIISYNVMGDEQRSDKMIEETTSERMGYIAVPIMDKDREVTHIIRCINKVPNTCINDTFNIYDLRLLEHLSGLISIFNDNYKSTEERLNFMQTILHESLSPINHIMGIGEELKDHYESASKQDHNIISGLKDIMTECSLLSAVLGGPGVETLTIEDLHIINYTLLSDIIEPCVGYVKNHEPYEKKTYKITKQKNIRLVECDVDRTIQVVMNMLINASKYSPVDGIINIDISEYEEFPSHYIKVEISNDGQTIPAEWGDKIFDRFQRPPESQRKHPEGTGYGLYVSKTIMKMQNGDVRLIGRKNPVKFAILFDITRIGL
jgi:transcriptional regulator with GAF, ATPase, and Fis domain